MAVLYLQGGFFMENFKLIAEDLLSESFRKMGIGTFEDAVNYIKDLPYKRNPNKHNPLCVFVDNGGTCSTKHALLKRLAEENSIHNVKLMLGIFKMTATNTPKIASVLKEYSLKEIPEAHNYLKINDRIFDFTRRNSKPEDFVDDLLEEIQIQPEQITDFKVGFHKNFIQQYLKENPQISYTLEEFWRIREECIAALQQ